MTEQQLTPEIIGSLVFIVLVLVLFAEHMRHAAVDWREDRDGPSLRALILAIALVVSLVTVLVSSLFRAGIVTLDAAVFLGYVARGMLIVAGIVDVVSWHADRRANKHQRSDDR